MGAAGTKVPEISPLPLLSTAGCCSGLLQPERAHKSHRYSAGHGASLYRMSRAALTLCLRWLALVALTQGATAQWQSLPPSSPPTPYWLEGVHCRGGARTILETLFNGGDLSRDEAKDACAFGCLATSGCAYADLYFQIYGFPNSKTYTNCYLRTDACGDYASNTNSFSSLFVVPPAPPSPPHPPPSDSACEVNR